MKKISSPELLLISECVNQTVQGMWGNATRPEPVREIKQIELGRKRSQASKWRYAWASGGPPPSPDGRNIASPDSEKAACAQKAVASRKNQTQLRLPKLN
jgi:hypothetical protein